MTIEFETKNGSTYRMYEKAGKTFCSKENSFKATVEWLIKPIRMNEPFEAGILKYDMYFNPEPEINYIKTTPIVKLVVTM